MKNLLKLVLLITLMGAVASCTDNNKSGGSSSGGGSGGGSGSGGSGGGSGSGTLGVEQSFNSYSDYQDYFSNLEADEGLEEGMPFVFINSGSTSSASGGISFGISFGVNGGFNTSSNNNQYGVCAVGYNSNCNGQFNNQDNFYSDNSSLRNIIQNYAQNNNQVWVVRDLGADRVELDDIKQNGYVMNRIEVRSNQFRDLLMLNENSDLIKFSNATVKLKSGSKLKAQLVEIFKDKGWGLFTVKRAVVSSNVPLIANPIVTFNGSNIGRALKRAGNLEIKSIKVQPHRIRSSYNYGGGNTQEFIKDNVIEFSL